jgi:hypothetical protein
MIATTAMNENSLALEDGKSAIKLDGNVPKYYFRCATACEALEDFEQAKGYSSHYPLNAQ